MRAFVTPASGSTSIVGESGCIRIFGKGVLIELQHLSCLVALRLDVGDPLLHCQLPRAVDVGLAHQPLGQLGEAGHLTKLIQVQLAVVSYLVRVRARVRVRVRVGFGVRAGHTGGAAARVSEVPGTARPSCTARLVRVEVRVRGWG